MRHQNKGFKLGRTQAHRKATLAALSNALIQHKRITTTLTKARALRMYVEPLINRSKSDTMNNRRQVFRHLQDNSAVSELFNEIGSRVADRPGGYTRIIKLGQRSGDAAEMAVIEIVDYNDVKPFGSSDHKKRRTRRGGRGRAAAPEAALAGAAAGEDDAEADQAPAAEASEEATETEPAAEEVAGGEEPPAAEASEEATEAEPAAEDVAEAQEAAEGEQAESADETDADAGDREEAASDEAEDESKNTSA